MHITRRECLAGLIDSLHEMIEVDVSMRGAPRPLEAYEQDILSSYWRLLKDRTDVRYKTDDELRDLAVTAWELQERAGLEDAPVEEVPPREGMDRTFRFAMPCHVWFISEKWVSPNSQLIYLQWDPHCMGLLMTESRTGELLLSMDRTLSLLRARVRKEWEDAAREMMVRRIEDVTEEKRKEKTDH